METIRITSTIKSISMLSNNFYVCDDIKSIIKTDNNISSRELELTNEKEYTREELLNNYDLKIIIKKWCYTYTDNGENALAIVIE